MGLATTISGLLTLLVGINLGFYQGIQDNRFVLAGLFVVAGVCWIVATVAISLIREEPGATQGGGNAGVEALKSLSLLKYDIAFRRFVIVRTLLLSVSLGAPMIVVLAQTALGSASLIGLFLVAAGLANSVSGYVWGRLADYSSRGLMAVCAGMNGLTGVALLTVIQIDVAPDHLVSLFVVAYFAVSVCLAGVRLGRKTLLVDMATVDTRSAYVAVSNTVIGLLILVVGAVVSLVANQDATIMLWIFCALSGLACALCPLWLPSQQDQADSTVLPPR